ncbi:MAG: accessory factor UbiK family protein [Rhodospirillales bacterium]|nr:accessory factor UbiK family protein [Rhodospirillales bacterium]MCB9973572.1 accessory factor UbiK family protein [Rhodospirillales bacterium]MCB9979624.1 accessory factor UbiK family protein [Rhodospirillales bacterium]
MFSGRVMDELAKMAGGTVSVATQVNAQIRQELRSRAEDLADRLDLVPRAEFDRVEEMLKACRLQQEALEKRVAALEKSLKNKK